MDYSYAYAKRRGLIGGNPKYRYELTPNGFKRIGGFGVGSRVKIIGVDNFIIGRPGALSMLGTITEAYDMTIYEIGLSRGLYKYENTPIWRVQIEGVLPKFVYWEHDLELI